MRHSWLWWNRLYIRAINDNDPHDIHEFFYTIITPGNCRNPYGSKRFVWNVLRGKGFYVTLANWIVDMIRETTYDDALSESMKHQRFEKVHNTLRAVLATERRERMRRTLVYNICRHVNLLTIETVQNMNAEKITAMLRSDKPIVYDETMEPIVNEIRRLRLEIVNQL